MYTNIFETQREGPFPPQHSSVLFSTDNYTDLNELCLIDYGCTRVSTTVVGRREIIRRKLHKVSWFVMMCAIVSDVWSWSIEGALFFTVTLTCWHFSSSTQGYTEGPA